jgi:hypothetical protein
VFLPQKSWENTAKKLGKYRKKVGKIPQKSWENNPSKTL